MSLFRFPKNGCCPLYYVVLKLNQELFDCFQNLSLFLLGTGKMKFQRRTQIETHNTQHGFCINIVPALLQVKITVKFAYRPVEYLDLVNTVQLYRHSFHISTSNHLSFLDPPVHLAQMDQICIHYYLHTKLYYKVPYFRHKIDIPSIIHYNKYHYLVYLQ